MQKNVHLMLAHLIQWLIKINMICLTQYLKGLPFNVIRIHNVLIVADTSLADREREIRHQIIHIHFFRNAKAMAHITCP